MAELLVLTGVNGAGKSSVAGVALEQQGGAYYNPDRAAAQYRALGLSPADAGSRAWHRGREQLEHAIRIGADYAFETTLGGRTITRHLIRAAEAGQHIRIWYVGLATPELHLRRVRARVDAGGHDIPVDLIRARWSSSRENLVRLLPHLHEVALYDNSAEASAGDAPRPIRILHARGGRIDGMLAPADVPIWAKPIVAAALELWH